MPKYIIWDKVSDIYTDMPHHLSGKMHWAAQEYIDEVAPWAELPESKIILSGIGRNGSYFLDFYERLEFYKSMGVEFSEEMSDREVLDLMEEFDNGKYYKQILRAAEHKLIATAEERMAAAMEFQTLLMMEGWENAI